MKCNICKEAGRSLCVHLRTVWFISYRTGDIIQRVVDDTKFCVYSCIKINCFHGTFFFMAMFARDGTTPLVGDQAGRGNIMVGDGCSEQHGLQDFE